MNYSDFFIEGKLPGPLNQKELYSYFEKMRSGDTKAREIIITHNIKLVIHRVKNRFYNTSYEEKELVSTGLVGLIKSVDSFSISRNLQFSTYSTKCIDNEILSFLKKEKKHINTDSLNSLSSTDKDENELSIADTLSDEDSDFISDYISKETSIIIKQIIEELPERDKGIITLYFGFNNALPLTQKEIANELNITQSCVSKAIPKILPYIKKQLKKRGIIESSGDEIITKYNPKEKSVKIKENEKIKLEQQNKVDSNNFNGKEIYAKILELLRTPIFKQLMPALPQKEAIIISLKLSSVPTESIANFLGIEESEVREATKKVLLTYKKSINQFIDTTIQVATDQSGLLKSKIKIH